MRAAGNSRVEIARIGGRTHNTIWSQVNKDGDEVASRIVAFVRGQAAGQRSR
ncbi:MAG TPA: hypothetical protein VGY57_15885 [Vicinamibacterales bacterium]|nr:hypothetical protein [Vicinamibacterales bacterium]